MFESFWNFGLLPLFNCEMAHNPQVLIPRYSPSISDEPRLTTTNSDHHNYGKLESLMQDARVEEIWINSPQRIFAARSGVSELTNIVMTQDEIHDLIQGLLMWGGRRLDLSHPFVDARLPDGSRLHVTIPTVTAEHWAVNVRKHLLKGKSLADLVELHSLDEELANFLNRAVVSDMNILVSGSTQAGKTTFLNALIGETAPRSRIITVEEVFELSPKVADWVALQTRTANLEGNGEIPLRRLVKEALRMRPTHLIVGEIREAESLDLLIALNSGLPGMGTIHANSGKDAISKIQLLPLLAGENISFKFIAPLVASAIDLVVHLGIAKSGERRVLEILHVTGRIEGDKVESETIFSLFETVESANKSKFSYSKGLGDINQIFKKKLESARMANDEI